MPPGRLWAGRGRRRPGPGAARGRARSAEQGRGPTGRPGPLGAPRGRASPGEGAGGRGPRPATHPTQVPAAESERSPEAAAAASRTTAPGPGPHPSLARRRRPGLPSAAAAARLLARPPAGAAIPGPAWPRGGAGGWGRACGGTLRPRRPLSAAGTAKRERLRAGRSWGRGLAREGKGPRSLLGDLAALRCRRGRRRRRCSAGASY